jgi:hypothetical protein
MTVLLKDLTNGRKFSATVLKTAGRKLKHEGEDAAKQYLNNEYNPDFVKRDFPLQAKCNIVATNKPINEWGISKLSAHIQAYIYSLSKNEYDSLSVGKNKESHELFLKLIASKIGVDKFEYYTTQGLNLILNQAKNIYNGVFVKVENKNKKAQKKVDKIKEENPDLDITPKVFSAINEKGFLLEKPGINNTLYGYSGCGLRPLHPTKDIKLIDSLPEPYNQYSRLPLDIINKRFNQPSDKSKRRRLRKNKNGAILLIAKFGKDWMVFDARGLLRQAYRHKMIRRGETTITELLELFTGDPVIYPDRMEVSLSFKADVAKFGTQKIVSYKKSKEFLLKETQTKSVSLITVDLGANEPIAYRMSKIENYGNSLSANEVKSGSLTQDDLDYLQKCRDAIDNLEKDIKESAMQKLCLEEQEEVRLYDQNSASKSKEQIFSKYNLSYDLPWDKMSNNTYFIANYLKDKGFDESIYMTVSKDKKITINDSRFAHNEKHKLSSELRQKLNLALYEVKKEDKRYRKLSVRRKELVRSIVNRLVKNAKELANTDKIFVAIENLPMTGGFFDVKGKRDIGWDNFFTVKKNNKWFIKDFHKAFSDLAPNKNITVFEYNPAYTSQTCPNCKYCDKDNRNGIFFNCKKCQWSGHADIDVATYNGEQVILTSEKLSGGERLGDAKSAGSSRKRKLSKSLDKTIRIPTAESVSIFQTEPLANQSVNKGNH